MENSIANKSDITLEETTFGLPMKLIEDFESETFKLDSWNNIAPY